MTNNLFNYAFEAPNLERKKRRKKLAIKFRSGNVFIPTRIPSFFLSLGRKRDERLRDDNGCRQKDEGRRGKEE